MNNTNPPASIVGPGSAVRGKQTRFEKFLWWCSGADPRILAHCPDYDRVKYFGLGGIVMATFVLAFVSSSYAIYIVFEPKQLATAEGVDFLTAGISLLIGLIWGAIIFNLERFIVSSTGKGDNTDNITGPEFLQALPRLFMGLVISLAISAPLEIRIMKSEIDAELQSRQQAYEIKLNASTDSVINGQMVILRNKVEPLQATIDRNRAEVEKRRVENNAERRLLDEEAQGKGSGTKGTGPIWRSKKENLNKKELADKEFEMDVKNRQAGMENEIRKYNAEIESKDKERDLLKKQNHNTVVKMAGLLERIKISHDIGGLVPWIIWAFFFVIEVGPIFFKLMISKSTYDYLVDNQKKLIEASRGIEVKESIYVDNGRQVIKQEEIYHEASRELDEKKILLGKQLELSRLIIDKWQAKQTAEIEKDPSKFIEPQA